MLGSVLPSPSPARRITYDPQKTDTIASLPSEVTNVFEMPIIRAVGTYFSLSDLAMMRHSGVMP